VPPTRLLVATRDATATARPFSATGSASAGCCGPPPHDLHPAQLAFLRYSQVRITRRLDLILVLPIAFRKRLNDLIDLGSRKSDGCSGQVLNSLADPEFVCRHSVRYPSTCRVSAPAGQVTPLAAAHTMAAGGFHRVTSGVPLIPDAPPYSITSPARTLTYGKSRTIFRPSSRSRSNW
jgi:hypothetical protein